jgi:hypothetical protein
MIWPVLKAVYGRWRTQRNLMFQNTTATRGSGTAYPSGAPEFTPSFSGVRVTRSILSCMCIFCRSLVVLLSFFFWPLCCLSFFDLRILITPLVSSNSSCQTIRHYNKNDLITKKHEVNKTIKKCCFCKSHVYINRNIRH